MRQAAKRRFGQHFLRDTGIAGKIAALVAAGPESAVLEVGAGDGALTAHLVPNACRFAAVEIDADHWETLEALLAPAPSARLIRGDFLSLDLGRLARELKGSAGRFVITGNLPYNIATPIIDRCLRLDPRPDLLVFMLQREVAQRITAIPNTREYGLLSVFVQHRAQARLAFRVSSACFVPRPRVESAVVTLHPKPQRFPASLDDAFDEVVRASFAHRRKTLVNSLKRDHLLACNAGRLLERAGLDGSRRAESLTLDEFERLATVLHAWRTGAESTDSAAGSK